MTESQNDAAKWEFGSAEWCHWAGELGARLLEEADLDLDRYEWGFSEIYTHTPERLMAGRDMAAFYFTISGGKISGGAGAPAENLALPGFHVEVPWASIAHASSYLYGRKGQAQRSADEKVMWAAIAEATGGTSPKAPPLGEKRDPKCIVCGSPDHERPDCPVWPPGIGEALSVGIEEESGLHNLTAKRLEHSPELAEFPKTGWGVPLFTEMNEEQQARFLKLIGK